MSNLRKGKKLQMSMLGVHIKILENEQQGYRKKVKKSKNQWNRKHRQNRDQFLI